MLRFCPYVLKTLWRHRTRTLLTVSGTAVALFVFAFVGAVQEGLAGLTERPAGRADADRLSGQPLLSEHQQAAGGLRPTAFARSPGVKDVVPIKVFMNNCRASLDVVVFNGMPAEKLRTFRDLTLLQGDWATFEKQRDAALVGRTVSSAAGWGRPEVLHRRADRHRRRRLLARRPAKRA